jgi:outer membrane protein OmpA-like peptidoglycan-associated protein
MRQFVFVCFFIFAAFVAQAQTKKGLKSLKKGKWDDAVAAFLADTASNNPLRPVAQWGLAQALSAPENPSRNYGEAMQFQTKAKDSFKALKSKERLELTKKYEITGGAIERVRTQAATNLYKEIEKDGALEQCNTYIKEFPKAPSKNIEKIKQRKTKLLKEAVANANTYEQMRDLTGKYREDVAAEFPASTLEKLDDRLLKTFIEQKGLDNLPTFYRDNPVHPAAKDPGAKRFPTVWKSENAKDGIEFLNKYPNSVFASYIRTKTLDMLKKTPLTETERNNLGKDAQLTLAEIELEASGNLTDTYGAYEESKKDGWMTYIQKLAPSDRAFAALMKMYKHDVSTRNWKDLSSVLRTVQPLFPAKKTWFEEIIPIIEAPETGAQPVNAGAAINAEGNEYIPVLSADGKTLYFCATKHDDNLDAEDIFVSTKSDTGWSAPKIVTELSGTRNQAPLSLSADGNKMILFIEGQPHQSSKQTDGKWTAPVALNIPGERFAWVGLVQIAANDQVMLFEARRDRGDKIDLYICQRDANGAWSTPAPMDSLNTAEDERSPYLHPDMTTLYFSSAGRTGIGGMDVYSTRRLDDTWRRWSKPVNIGKELNTLERDWAYKISTDGQIAWFSSKGADKTEDIYYVSLPEAVRPQAVKLVELSLTDDQGKPFTGSVLLENPVNGKTEGTFQANPSGGITTITVPNDKPYNIRLVQPGYFPVSMSVPVTAPGQPLTLKSTIKPVNLEKMVASGQSITLNLLFDYDKSELKSESLPELRKVADVAQKNKYKISLMGYTDNAGNPTYNQTLSQQRAEAARKALIELGVAPEHITATGYGESKPVATNNTDEGRAKNRRVEVQFKGM